MPLLEIKDFNLLIGNKPFFDQPIKNKQEEYEKLVDMSRNDYTTGNCFLYQFTKKTAILGNMTFFRGSDMVKIGANCNFQLILPHFSAL